MEYEKTLQPLHTSYMKYEEKYKEIQNKYRTYLKSIFDNIDSEDRVYNDTDLILGDIESLRILQNTLLLGISFLIGKNENDNKS